eukprot:TRINITY_DN799_c1_g2_i1.p1 TRINITY_DN799_c1_g2~~TRINITY_DN799_c1_g2_i1.p1  ORF type:complete len:223 (+),score=71.40 TRINITY_DN799_c1_g2_i1:48-671(+)
MATVKVHIVLNDVKEKDAEVTVPPETSLRDAVTLAVEQGLCKVPSCTQTIDFTGLEGTVGRDQSVEVKVTRKLLHKPIERTLVMRMMERENELRTCEETQIAYTQYDSPFDSGVTEGLQKRVLWEFDIPGTDEALDVYHTQRWYHRNDKEVQSVPLYIKYDISRAGDLKMGDVAPDVHLVTCKGEDTKLSSFMNAGRPLVVVAGSYS